MRHASRLPHHFSFCTSNTAKQPTFGIIAAITKDGVIGVDGALPWKRRVEDAPTNIHLDRERFVTLTRNKILILGRKTFADEDPTGAHVKHARACIVVSKTMNPSDLVEMKRDADSGVVGACFDSSIRPAVRLARSFDEALDMASKDLLPIDDGTTYGDQGGILNDEGLHDIHCWVAGGEMIYKEALQHCNASVVHLTHVDMIVKQNFLQHHAIAHYPAKDMERGGFREIRRENKGGITFCLYKKQCKKTT